MNPRSHAPLRFPAVPLFAYNPYFSVWSFADALSGDETRHWTGAHHSMASMIRIDGVTYRLMGAQPAGIPALPQDSCAVLPTRTLYDFEGAGVRLRMVFLTPLLPHDLGLYARPVSYLTWELQATDGGSHEVQLYFDCTGELVVDKPDQAVIANREAARGLVAARIGSRDQAILAKKGDDLRIDWGYLYLAAPTSGPAARAAGGRSESTPSGMEATAAPLLAIAAADDSRAAFARSGSLADLQAIELPRPAAKGWPVLALAITLGAVSTSPVSRHLLIAYDEISSIEYMGRRLAPYWRRSGGEATPAALLEAAERDYERVTTRAARFDERLMQSLEEAGGKAYAQLAALSFRQSLAAQTLVEGPSGEPYYFPKENFSNGCLGTVDVIYPEAPLLLLLNPKLLEAALAPVFDYAESDRWRFPFAPHDLGTYPIANGQVYGGGESSEVDQMPVEESGDMILLAAALVEAEGAPDFAARHWSVLTRWAEYLREAGFDPTNQLSTDDFAGHLARNANLSLKAILALAAYGRLAEALGKGAAATEYRTLAEEFARRWIALAVEGDHTRLAFDRAESWSQKYNLVWDRILGLGLFPPEVVEREVAFALGHLERYGLPLDSRRSYTKLDWEVWVATLAERRADFERLIEPLLGWTRETPSRVPLTDWYDTKSGKQEGFQARSVVGGVFVKMLADRQTWREWLTTTL